MEWTAKKLYMSVLEFVAMVPDNRGWGGNYMRTNINDERAVRFQRIVALLKAFGLSRIKEKKKHSGFSFFKKRNLIEDFNQSEIQLFLNGDFIKHNEIERYAEVIKVINEWNRLGAERPISTNDILTLFRHLMSYSISLEKVFRINNEVLMASSPGLIAALKITGKANTEIWNHRDKIDKILVGIIDQENKVFSEFELIEKFGFPDVDLDKLDADNW